MINTDLNLRILRKGMVDRESNLPENPYSTGLQGVRGHGKVMHATFRSIKW